MAARETEIRGALNALREVSHSSVAISRTAVGEVERLVGIIDSLTNNPDVKAAGQLVVARTLGRFVKPPISEEISAVLGAASLPGAIARYEDVIQKAGFLTSAS